MPENHWIAVLLHEHAAESSHIATVCRDIIGIIAKYLRIKHIVGYGFWGSAFVHIMRSKWSSSIKQVMYDNLCAVSPHAFDDDCLAIELGKTGDIELITHVRKQSKCAYKFVLYGLACCGKEGLMDDVVRDSAEKAAILFGIMWHGNYDKYIATWRTGDYIMAHLRDIVLRYDAISSATDSRIMYHFVTTVGPHASCPHLMKQCIVSDNLACLRVIEAIYSHGHPHEVWLERAIQCRAYNCIVWLASVMDDADGVAVAIADLVSLANVDMIELVLSNITVKVNLRECFAAAVTRKSLPVVATLDKYAADHLATPVGIEILHEVLDYYDFDVFIYVANRAFNIELYSKSTELVDVMVCLWKLIDDDLKLSWKVIGLFEHFVQIAFNRENYMDILKLLAMGYRFGEEPFRKALRQSAASIIRPLFDNVKHKISALATLQIIADERATITAECIGAIIDDLKIMAHKEIDAMV